jgi:hypothetical protein
MQNKMRKRKNVLNEYEKISSRKCPKCSSQLIETYALNPEIFGTKRNTRSLVCRNDKCKGWFCDYCQEWHPYGTICSVAMVRNTREDRDFCTSYEEWIEQEESWERTYNPSKRNNSMKRFLLSAKEISVDEAVKKLTLSPSSKKIIDLLATESKRRKLPAGGGKQHG